MRDHIAEVVETSTSHIVAECRELNGSPPFGSFVKVVSEPVAFGLVCEIATRSLDPTRRPTAYGKTEEELRLEQPQIFELLRTEFHALLVGYLEGESARQILPPQPPRLHSFVYACGKEEVRQFTAHPDYLRILFATSRPASDELIIAACRTALAAHDHDPEHLIRTGKELSHLLRSDYQRLNAIIRRIGQ